MIFTKTKYPGKSHNLIVFIQAYCLYFDKKTVKKGLPQALDAVMMQCFYNTAS